MGESLYGQGKLLDELVPSLLGLERTREHRSSSPARGREPILQVVGGRGSGKSALLHALSESYRNRVPLAERDLGAPGFGEAGLAELAAQDTPNSSPVTTLLYLLSDQLGLRLGSLRRELKFRRLSVGLLVISTWQPAAGTDNRPPGLRDAERQLREILSVEDPDQRRRKETLRQWLDALIAPVSTAIGVPTGLDGMFRTVATTARELLLAPHPDRGVLQWWREQLPMAQGDGLQRLFSFVRDFRRLDDSRAGAEVLLIAALLADLDENYGRWHRANQTPRPLILLDNVDSPAGDRFFERLRTAYDRQEHATRPVIVATSLGDPGPLTPLTEAVESLNATPSRLLRLGLPPIRRDDIMAMLSPLDYPQHLPLLIERLSGGRPSTARLLVQDAKELPATGESLPMDDFLALFDQASSTGTTARLLARLLPSAELRERLTLLSPALDDTAARYLWRAFHPEENAGEHIAQAREHLDKTRWHLRPWPLLGGTAPFIADRGLRALLLRQLRLESGGERWARVHRRLRAGYDPANRGSASGPQDARYLHHSLALGETEQVVRMLHERFGADAPGDWLATVNLICAAPRPPGERPPQSTDTLTQPLALSDCAACTDPAAVPVHRAVNRLVHALWWQSAPLSVPREDQIERVATALNTLYDHVDENDALLRAHREWPKRLRDGVQAPDLPITGGFNA
ncbi:hypothetical protein [Kitasatospora sp. McL0602]|uniref:hypothetical protein n=1 Tax=Kitasatospora sp. McL0602 TaxID=3439530 RepID=UPI003F8872C1